MTNQELEQTLTKLKDTNALIDPIEMVRLIEEVGGWIDDLDLQIIELEEQVNIQWKLIEVNNPTWPKIKVTNELKLTIDWQVFREQTALLKRLRRHYRLLNTKLNLLTKPKGR